MILQMTKNTKNYEYTGYADKISDDKIPPNDKFQWKNLDYYVLIAPFTTIDDLPRQISIKIRQFLKNT